MSKGKAWKSLRVSKIYRNVRFSENISAGTFKACVTFLKNLGTSDFLTIHFLVLLEGMHFAQIITSGLASLSQISTELVST